MALIVKRVGDWAVAADGQQWILRNRFGEGDGWQNWQPLSFVHSTRDVLARCMREKGVPAEVAVQLLDGLPSTFAEWARGARPGRT